MDSPHQGPVMRKVCVSYLVASHKIKMHLLVYWLFGISNEQSNSSTYLSAHWPSRSCVFRMLQVHPSQCLYPSPLGLQVCSSRYQLPFTSWNYRARWAPNTKSILAEFDLITFGKIVCNIMISQWNFAQTRRPCCLDMCKILLWNYNDDN